MRDLARVCMVARIPGVAGPAAFQRRLAAGLQARGTKVDFDLRGRSCAVGLVIGGTSNLAELWRARRRGMKIVQRLDGMNWIHRRRRTGARHFLKAEANNRLLQLIRRRLADRVVYQSEFARGWWEQVYGPGPPSTSVIHNAVPLDVYTPDGPREGPAVGYRLLIVEGNLAGGYEIGIQWAVGLAQGLQASLGERVELQIAGAAAASLRRKWQSTEVHLRWLGLVQPEEIPHLDRSAHLLYAADLNPACPNAVIEALACGTPVVGFDTGAMGELVVGDSGRLAAYGGDPWRLEPPDMEALVQAAIEVLHDLPRFRAGARARAEAEFGLEKMVDEYVRVMGEGL